MYRILQQLAVKGGRMIERGSIDALKELPAENIAILIERRIIAPVSAPPLSAINEDWRRIATKLEKYGIMSLDQFIEADVASLRRWLRTNTAAVEQLKAAARQLLMPD